jgi:hypothetical protein
LEKLPKIAKIASMMTEFANVISALIDGMLMRSKDQYKDVGSWILLSVKIINSLGKC